MGRTEKKDRMYTATKQTEAASPKRKSATDRLAEKMADLVDRAAMRMNDKEFKAAEKKSAEIIARVCASRRETK
jgi:hypothetical protein